MGSTTPDPPGHLDPWAPGPRGCRATGPPGRWAPGPRATGQPGRWAPEPRATAAGRRLRVGRRVRFFYLKYNNYLHLVTIFEEL